MPVGPHVRSAVRQLTTAGMRRADLGAAGAVATLDFGGLPYAIYADKNATLSFNNMLLTGVAYGSSYVNNTRNSPYGACSCRMPVAESSISQDHLCLAVVVPCADHSQHLLAAGKYPTPGLALFPSFSSAPGANVRFPDSITMSAVLMNMSGFLLVDALQVEQL